MALDCMLFPQAMTRHLARKAGWVRARPGVLYKPDLVVPQTSQRLQWVSITQHATSTAELALQLRILDSVIDWDALKKPAAESACPQWFHAIVKSRRPTADGAGFEYLVGNPPNQGDPGLLQFTGKRVQARGCKPWTLWGTSGPAPQL